MDIYDMFKNGQYEDILDQNFEKVKSLKLSKISEKYYKNICLLLYVYFACYKLGYYRNCVCFGNKIIKELSNSSLIKEVKPTIFHIYFESLLYFLINGIDLSNDFPLDIFRETNKLSKAEIINENSENNELLHIYNDYCNGKLPYYKLGFLIPYEPLFQDYQFDLSNCYPFISLTIKEAPRRLENGDIHDTFTFVEFSLKGLVNNNPRWNGDDWEQKERLPHIKQCLPLLNMLYLYAGNSTKTFVPTICIEQISSINISQYSYDNIQINWSMGTDFSAELRGLNVPKHKYTIDELKLLNDWVVSSFGSEAFVSLYQQAKNNISAGLYVESFLLLCSCCESMFYYWCDRLCKLVGVHDEYITFSKTRLSSCNDCPLYKKSDKKIEYNKGLEPSIYKHIKFLADKCTLSKKKEKELSRYVAKIRNDTLRNDVVHGRTNKVSLSQVNQSLKLIMKLQREFLEIEKSIKARKCK